MLGPSGGDPRYGGGEPRRGENGHDGYGGNGKGDNGYGKGDGYGRGPPGYDAPAGYGKGGPPGYGGGGYPPQGYDAYGKGGYGGCQGYPPASYPGYPPQGYGGAPGWGPPQGAPGWGAPPWGAAPGWGAPPGWGPPGCSGGWGEKGWGGPPGFDMWGKGGGWPGQERPRSRSRSPLPIHFEGTIKETEAGPPLERHAGAQRDNRPAWMTKGVGVGTEMFGESKGDLAKPGMTFDDLKKIESSVPEGPDPFGDVFKEAKEPAQPASGPELGASEQPKRAPLPDQSTLFGGATGAPVSAAPAKMGGFKVEMCTFFPEGKCTKGESCTYAHTEAELRR